MRPAGLDRFPGGRGPLRVPPEERVPSMAKGDELGRVGGVDMIVKNAGGGRSAASVTWAVS